VSSPKICKERAKVTVSPLWLEGFTSIESAPRLWSLLSQLPAAPCTPHARCQVLASPDV